MFLRALAVLTRLSLAVIFIYAGITKVQQPALFALAIDAYQLLPAWAVLAVAYALPWVEIALGVALAASFWRRPIALASTVLLGLFFTAMFVTYLRNIQADCGCFGFGEAISPRTLVRDGTMVLASGFLLWRSWLESRKASA